MEAVLCSAQHDWIKLCQNYLSKRHNALCCQIVEYSNSSATVYVYLLIEEIEVLCAEISLELYLYHRVLVMFVSCTSNYNSPQDHMVLFKMSYIFFPLSVDRHAHKIKIDLIILR